MKKIGCIAAAVLLLAGAARAEMKTIPGDTKVTVRTNESIDSKAGREGQTYSAVIERDVTDESGAVLIPKGSPAQLVIRKASSGGTTGSPQLALDLQEVTLEGRRYTVNTADLEQSNRRGIGRNRRTAEMLGGGAALGTVIGAVAGGGKGAILGAITGAAAGGAVQVLTKGKEVRVPAESVLTFRLAEPLRLDSR